ncbi:galactose oxidase/kelch repeat superfamily protein [Striga asiatica]|uniref:Galactose oxidase/kelch repeat superfamily protein n=1 Tax=Striga asiatica TaxID=4170 RepID=A0A5A7PRN3_STRAF|nr:galactose oxidase/kelch repeat superfamily protein [Striga asiatica]
MRSGSLDSLWSVHELSSTASGMPEEPKNSALKVTVPRVEVRSTRSTVLEWARLQDGSGSGGDPPDLHLLALSFSLLEVQRCGHVENVVAAVGVDTTGSADDIAAAQEMRSIRKNSDDVKL